MRNAAIAVAAVLVLGFAVVGDDKPFGWKVSLETDKEVLVKFPIKDGKLVGPRTEQGRQVYEPISVIPVKITVTNTGKRSVKFAAGDFDLTMLDPRRQPLREHTDYAWKEGREELRAQQVLLEPGKSHTFTRAIHVVHATLEDGQTYTLEHEQRNRDDYARTTFIAKVPRRAGEPAHADFFDSIVELRGGKAKGCGVIFWYDPRKKEAYVLTAGEFIGDTKQFTAKVAYRGGKKLTKLEEYPARVVGSHGGEFAVLAFPLAARPRFFPLADKDYDYSRHPELVCVRWNEKEGMTARLVAPRGFTKGTLSVYYSEPGNGISGAGLFDRRGLVVGVGWGPPSSVHSNRLGLFVSLLDIYPFFEKAKFTLPPRGVIGITVSTAKDKAGVHVNEVAESGPAAKAGLKAGDIIQAVDGLDVADVDRLISIIQWSGGSELTLQVLRGGDRLPVKVTVGKGEAGPRD